MAKITKTVHFADRGGWRDWLRANGATTDEIWLVRYKKHTGRTSVSVADAQEEALCFGWIDGLVKRIDDAKYAIRFTPRRDNSVWSQLNKDRVKKLIEQGRMTDAGLAKVKAAKRNGQWDQATQREDLTKTPPDLRKALAADPKAKAFFEQLAGSHKKLAIGWILSAKRDETRKKRIAEVVGLAAQAKRLGMK